MAFNPLDAVSAYKQSGGFSGQAAAAGGGAGSSGGGFADALKSFLGDSVSALHQGEKAASDAAVGKADLTSVVTAIDNAEVVLDEIVAIRDKAIAAYQSITSGAI